MKSFKSRKTASGKKPTKDQPNPGEQVGESTIGSTDKDEPTEGSTVKDEPTEVPTVKGEPTEVPTEKCEPAEGSTEEDKPTEGSTEKEKLIFNDIKVLGASLLDYYSDNKEFNRLIKNTMESYNKATSLHEQCEKLLKAKATLENQKKTQKTAKQLRTVTKKLDALLQQINEEVEKYSQMEDNN